ncbi:RF-PROK-I domain-containing protein [Aphelenchoides besseyi]|nr:RF-PROK-I domain-containing protein [Aphelenchoides besseyi]
MLRSFCKIIGFTQLRNIEIWESGCFPKDDFRKRLMRAGGPGGQNVNNVSTKVEIRFDVHKVNWLPSDVREFLIRKERNRINKLGELVISSDKTRHAESNEADCYVKLQSMIVECVRQVELTNREPTDKDKQILDQREFIAEQRRRQLKEQLKKKRENRSKWMD